MAVPAQEMEDDSVLVRAVQAGDLEAYSELFRRHYPSVQRACARRMACPLEAEEIAQSAEDYYESQPAAFGLYEPDALDITKHPRAPARGLSRLVDRQRVHLPPV